MTLDYDDYEQKCKKIVKESGIRFAALINPLGNFLVGGPKEGLELLETEAERKKLYMEIVLRVTSRKDFDDKLGPVTFAASRRGKVVVLTFPLETNVLLVSAEPSVNIEDTAQKILKLFT